MFCKYFLLVCSFSFYFLNSDFQEKFLGLPGGLSVEHATLNLRDMGPRLGVEPT